MKLSEIKGDNALDLLADLIDPVVEIVVDQEFAKAFDSGDRIRAIKVMLKNHKKAITTILALLNEEDPETFKPDILTLPRKVIELMEDESQRQTDKSSFGDATENTEAKKQ